MLNERTGKDSSTKTLLEDLSECYEKYLQSTGNIRPLHYKMKICEAVFSPPAVAVNI
jgi:hypothetical protein